MSRNIKEPINVLRIEPVAAYVRVSTQEQKLHGLSLDAQKMKLAKYAKEHNMRIVEWYMDEGVSARKLIRNRPELQRMIQDAEKEKFDRIIFIKLDRFFRSVAEYHECMKRISPVTWSTTEEEYDLATANGRMLVNMKITIAEMEADQTGERINIVNEYKLSTGQPLTGSMPFGFKIVIDEKTRRKKIIKDPEKKDIVEDLLQYMFKHQSKRKALSYMHAKYHIGMTYTSLSKLLNNTLLCGQYRDNPSYNEAYITREEFDRLQYIVNSNIKQYAEKRDYYFSGLIKCPNCRYRLSGNSQLCRTKEGNEYRYKKYRCANHNSHHNCNFNKAVSENIIEKMLLKNINKYLEDARIRIREIKDADLTVIPKYDIDDINAEIDRLNYSWRSGKLRSIEEYDKEYDELLTKLDMAEAERDIVITKDFDRIEKILANGWKEIYKNLDAAHKRAFWRSFISSIEINWTTNKKEIVRINFL